MAVEQVEARSRGRRKKRKRKKSRRTRNCLSWGSDGRRLGRIDRLERCCPTPAARARRHLGCGGIGDDREARFRRRRRKTAIRADGRGVPKVVHDYKAAIHALDPLGIALAGVRHDPMLYSYLLDPTYSSHRLADVALRRFNLKLAEELAESADITGRLAGALRSEVEQAGLAKLYEEMDLPLVPVLARMEQAGVKIDTAALSQMSSELEREIAAKAKEIYEVAGMEFNVGSPKQLGDVLFNRMNLPKPVKYGKGRTISTAVDVLEELAENHPIARMVLDYRQLTKLKSTYVDALPALINPASRTPAHDVRADGNGDRTAVFGESEPAEHSHSHRTGTRNSRRLHRRARPRAADRRLFADRVAAAGAFFARFRCWSRPTAAATTFIR